MKKYLLLFCVIAMTLPLFATAKGPETDFEVSPNPASGHAVVTLLSGTLPENARVTVTDMIGLVKSTALVEQLKTVLSLADCAPGYYIVTVTSGSTSNSHRILVQ